MTYRERIKRALSEDGWKTTEPGEPDYINRLIQVAYYMAKTEGVRTICDQHSAQLRQAREKAQALRYHKMAEAILPSSDLIYHPDYSGDFAETFGGDPYPEVR